MAVVTHFGDRFTVIHQVALERNPYEAMHYWAFYVGISLAGLLSLGAALSTIATVREAHGLMAAGFLCFALSFCVLVQVAFWRFHNPTQVEDAVLDTYDFVYDQAMKSPSSSWWQELATIQDTFLCCGKKSPFGFLASTRAILCQGQEAMREVRRGKRVSVLRSNEGWALQVLPAQGHLNPLCPFGLSHFGICPKVSGCTRPPPPALTPP
ncbi:Tspan32 [Lemmus lemmus]